MRGKLGVKRDDPRYTKLWNEANPEKWREYRLRYNYNIGLAEKAAMMVEQRGRCAICGNQCNLEDLQVDHDHFSGMVRGLLCVECNKGLGCFRDDPSSLEKAASYIKRYMEVGFKLGKEEGNGLRKKLDPNENLFE
jgi:hypothetical protein